MSSEKKSYNYSFSVWPVDDYPVWRASVFDYFQLLSRVEMRFTQESFEHFADEMKDSGFTLREVERVPYFQPETVLA